MKYTLYELINEELRRREIIASSASSVGDVDPWMVAYGDQIVARVNGGNTCYNIANYLRNEHAIFIAVHNPADAIADIRMMSDLLTFHEPCEPGECMEEHGGTDMCHGCELEAKKCVVARVIARRLNITV